MLLRDGTMADFIAGRRSRVRSESPENALSATYTPSGIYTSVSAVMAKAPVLMLSIACGKTMLFIGVPYRKKSGIAFREVRRYLSIMKALLPDCGAKVTSERSMLSISGTVSLLAVSRPHSSRRNIRSSLFSVPFIFRMSPFFRLLFLTTAEICPGCLTLTFRTFA